MGVVVALLLALLAGAAAPRAPDGNEPAMRSTEPEDEPPPMSKWLGFAARVRRYLQARRQWATVGHWLKGVKAEQSLGVPTRGPRAWGVKTEFLRRRRLAARALFLAAARALWYVTGRILDSVKKTGRKVLKWKGGNLVGGHGH